MIPSYAKGKPEGNPGTQSHEASGGWGEFKEEYNPAEDACQAAKGRMARHQNGRKEGN